MHISLTCADPDSPWTLTQLDSIFPNRPTSKSPSNKHTVFSDISSTTYALSPSVTLPIAIPPRQADLGLSLPYVVDSSGAGGLNDADVEGEATSPTSTTIPTPTTASVPTPLLSPLPALTIGSLPHPVGLLPKSTTCLIRVPRSQPAFITMLHIHLLWTYCYPPSLIKRSDMLDPVTVHADVTKNFHELSVLAQSRWKMSAPGAGSGIGIADSGSGNVGRASRTDVNPILPLHLAMVELMSRITEGVDGAEIDC